MAVSSSEPILALKIATFANRNCLPHDRQKPTSELYGKCQRIRGSGLWARLRAHRQPLSAAQRRTGDRHRPCRTERRRRLSRYGALLRTWQKRAADRRSLAQLVRPAPGALDESRPRSRSCRKGGGRRFRLCLTVAVSSALRLFARRRAPQSRRKFGAARSEEHTSELQSHVNLVCRLLLEKK